MLNNIFCNKYPTNYRTSPYIGYFNHNNCCSFNLIKYKSFKFDGYLLKNPFIGYINHSCKSCIDNSKDSVRNKLITNNRNTLEPINISMEIERDNDDDNIILNAISSESELDTISLDEDCHLNTKENEIKDDSIIITDESIDINELVIDNYLSNDNVQLESSSECDRENDICLDLLISETESKSIGISETYEIIDIPDEDIGISYESFCKVGELLNCSQ